MVFSKNWIIIIVNIRFGQFTIIHNTMAILQRDVNKQIQEFIGDKSYLFTRTICTDWSDYVTKWGETSKKTSIKRTLESLTLTKEALSNNLPWEREPFYKKKRKILSDSSLVGNLSVMKHLYKVFPGDKKESHDEETFSDGAKNGNLGNMKWLKSIGCTMNISTFSSAAEKGKLMNMKWLLENNCPIDGTVFTSAAKNGNLRNMKWLLEKKIPMEDNKTMNAAIVRKDLTNIKWLFYNGCTGGIDTVAYAAYEGDLETMQWMFFHGAPLYYHTLRCAFYNGNVENMKWLVSLGCDLCEIGYHHDTEKWNSEAVKYLRSVGCEWGEWTSFHISRYGTLEDLKWLKEDGYELDGCLMEGAVDIEDMDKVKWLRSNGCPWDEFSFSSAAFSRNLDMMKYLHSNGCPWDESVFESVDNYEEEEGKIIMDWLIANNAPGSEDFDYEEWLSSWK